MQKLAVLATAVLAALGIGIATAQVSHASVCQPDGAGCTPAGVYPGPDAVINSDYSGFRVAWTESVVEPYSSGVPLYWTASITYTNVSGQTLDLGCPGAWTDPGFVAEYMSGGSGDDGSVPAQATACSQNPGMNQPIPPGGTFSSWATFHNVPWPGSAVAIHWGDAGTSPAVYPFAAQAPNPGPTPTPSPTPTPTHSHAPPKPPVHYGGNWNGYVRYGKTYAVGAVFTVPRLHCPRFTLGLWPAASPWVGLGGGQTGSALVQDGIASNCLPGGIQANFPFWQLVPAPWWQIAAQRVLFKTTSPGDTIYASVDYQGGDRFYLSLTDTNRKHGWHWSKTVTQQAEHGTPDSADWIVEAGGPPLADFGSVTFSASSFAPAATGGQLVTSSEVAEYIQGPQRSPSTWITGITNARFTIHYIRT